MDREQLIELIALWGAVCFGAGWAACGMWLDRCLRKGPCLIE